MNKRIFSLTLSAILIFSLALTITGCATKKPVEKLRIGVVSDLGAAPFIIAEQQGYFKDKGLDIEIQVFKSAVDRDTAFQTGNLDGSMADMLTAIFFNEAGFNVKMTSQTYGNYRMVTAPKLSKEAFLKMDKISVGISSNTVIDFATGKISEANAIQNKLNKVAIPQMPVRLEMLKAGELNAATLPEPLASAAVAGGGAIVGSTLDYNLFPGIFLMSKATLENNPEAVKLMYQCYNQAVEYLNKNDSKVYFDLLIEKLGYPASIKGNFKMPEFTPALPADKSTFEEVSSWMESSGLIKQKPKYEDLNDADFLSK